MAASWIQFMVHDWFVHKRSPPADGIEIPLPPGDDWPGGKMRSAAACPIRARRLDTPAGVHQQQQPLVGRVAGLRLRDRDVARSSAAAGRQAEDRASGLLPVDPATGIDFTGFTDNWWIGLAMLHTLFALEHNYLCDELAKLNPAGPTRSSSRRRSSSTRR